MPSHERILWAHRSSHRKYSSHSFLTFPPIRTWAWSLASFSWFIVLCLKNEVQIQIKYQNIKKKITEITQANTQTRTHHVNNTKQLRRRSICTTMTQTNATFDVASVRGSESPSLSLSARCRTHLATDSQHNQHGPPKERGFVLSRAQGRLSLSHPMYCSQTTNLPQTPTANELLQTEGGSHTATLPTRTSGSHRSNPKANKFVSRALPWAKRDL